MDHLEVNDSPGDQFELNFDTDFDVDGRDFEGLLDDDSNGFDLAEEDVQNLMQHDSLTSSSSNNNAKLSASLNNVPLRHINPTAAEMDSFIQNNEGNIINDALGTGGVGVGAEVELMLRDLMNDELQPDTDSVAHDSLQWMANEAIEHGEGQLPTTTPAMDQEKRNLEFIQMEMEKMELLEKLKELQQESNSHSQSMNNAQSNTISMPNQGHLVAPRMEASNAFVAPMSHQTQFVSSMQQVQQQQQQQIQRAPFVPPMQQKTASVAGGGGESALASFLRGSRKSMNEPQQVRQQLQGASVFSQNNIGATASVSSIFASAGGGKKIERTKSPAVAGVKGIDFYSSMDRSAHTRDMVRQISDRNDSGHGTKPLAGNKSYGQPSNQNAEWGASGVERVLRRDNAEYSRSGVLPQHASESHLNRRVMMPRNSSGKNLFKKQLTKQGSERSLHNSLHSSDSLRSLTEAGLPVRRANPSAKYNARTLSVPHLLAHSGSRRSMNKGGSQQNNATQQNATWG
jgi:hypothetical protein